MIVRHSERDHASAVAALVEGIERRGLTVFARFDHAEGARTAGLELGAEEVVVFGDPRAGTPLMQRDPRIGIELPLRMLVWEADGNVRLGYLDPRELAGRYDVAERVAVLERMAGLLAELADEASRPPHDPAPTRG